MRCNRVLVALLAASALTLTACDGHKSAGASAARPMTVLHAEPGQIIEYGGVAGAQSLAAAMGSVLREIHQACGERPQVGQVFRVTGTNSSGVFFTVIDHAQADRPLAGLVIAAQTGTDKFEAGVVADTASSFGQSANPMMQQLFAAWKPGGSQGGTESGGAPQAASQSADAALHPVTAPDNSATISVPDGWQIDRASHMGAVILKGANGELVGLQMSKPAVDPTHPWRVRVAAGGYNLNVPGTVLYPYRGDPVREFVPIFQAWRRSNGLGPAQIEIEDARPMQQAQTQGNTHCANAAGKIDPNGKGMLHFVSALCVLDPDPQYGNYSITLSITMVPVAMAEREKPLVNAILRSYTPNQQVIQAEINQMLRAKQQSDANWLQWGQQQSARIRAQGQAAAARFSAIEQANDAQHAQYWARQDSNARGGAGFSNYLLDQSVVQNNNVAGTGMVGHSTEWNSTANALVRANPNKYEIVNTPNYWQGVDY